MQKRVPINTDPSVKYGRLRIIKEVKDLISKSGKKTRMVEVICDCGTSKSVRYPILKSGRVRSCGCLKRERITKHGEYTTRLYKCWIDMKSRSRKREDCEVYKEWRDDFINFKKWALSNGYQDDLILCRNKDQGNYEPNNCRWDTPQANLEESFALNYLVTKPCGEKIYVYNLHKFCKENKLDSGHMSKVCSGKLKHHKGYKVVKCKRKV